MEHFDLIVIGGGAAGIFAALRAASSNPNLNVLVLEKNKTTLAKLRISGGGRCNVTHACFEPTELVSYYPRGGKELRGAFSRFQPLDTIEWFNRRGVKLKTETDGRMFPTTDRSETIIDCFLNELARLKIDLRTNQAVTNIQKRAGLFSVFIKETPTPITAPQVLIAMGGSVNLAYKIAADLGHTIIPPAASLFTFKIKDPRLKDLAGISLPDAEISLLIKENNGKSRTTKATTGPLLITHWGLSGPVVLKQSAWAARQLAETSYQCQVQINLLHHTTPETFFKQLLAAKAHTPHQLVSKQDPTRQVPSRFWQRLVSHSGIGERQPWVETSNQKLSALANEITRGIYSMTGKSTFKEEFVTCGGVSLKEINFKTMESKPCPGLYFAGEILDIDGLTGGFNFQSAWTTGWLAGSAIAGNPAK